MRILFYAVLGIFHLYDLDTIFIGGNKAVPWQTHNYLKDAFFFQYPFVIQASQEIFSLSIVLMSLCVKYDENIYNYRSIALKKCN